MTNIGAAVVFVHTVYPGVSGEKIVAAFLDGTWINRVINLALIYFLYRDGKEQP